MENRKLKEKFIALSLFTLFNLSVNIKAQNLQFAWQFNTTTSIDAKGIEVDEDGNVIVLLRLSSSGTVDCDPSTEVYNIISAGENDIVICKYNPQGELIWAKQIGGTGNDIGDNLTLDLEGNIYFSGNFQNTIDVDPGPNIYNLTAGFSSAGFVIKLDTFGNMIWVKYYPLGISCFKIDGDSNLLISGTFQGTRDFDPGAQVFNMTSVGSSDIYIAKLNDSGNLSWAVQIGGTQFENIISMDIDIDGNVYLTGNFSFNADFDPGDDQYYLTSQGNMDVFIERINSDGTFGWAFQIGGEDNDYARQIKFDSLNYLYITGVYKGTVDFDPSPAVFTQTSIALKNMYISKLDLDGNLIWAKQLSCETNISESIGAIRIDESNNIIIAGQYAGTVDFDPASATTTYSTSLGGFDLYISKLNSNGELLGLTTLGSNGNEGATDITFDIQNYVYLGGFFNGTLDFDSGPEVVNLTSSGLNSCFIAKTIITPIETGIENTNQEHSILIFPNPTAGRIEIEFSDFYREPFLVTITDISGKTIKTLEISNQSNFALQLDTAAGIYFINFKNSTHCLTQKFILQ